MLCKCQHILTFDPTITYRGLCSVLSITRGMSHPHTHKTILLDCSAYLFDYLHDMHCSYQLISFLLSANAEHFFKNSRSGSDWCVLVPVLF